MIKVLADLVSEEPGPSSWFADGHAAAAPHGGQRSSLVSFLIRALIPFT